MKNTPMSLLTDQQRRMFTNAPELFYKTKAFLAWFKEFDGHAVWSECAKDCQELKELMNVIEAIEGDK